MIQNTDSITTIPRNIADPMTCRLLYVSAGAEPAVTEMPTGGAQPAVPTTAAIPVVAG